MRRTSIPPGLLVVLLSGGCHQAILDRTDRDVYRTIEDRQRAALGASSDVSVDLPRAREPADERMYRFNPRPITPELPEGFQVRPGESAGSVNEADRPPAARDEFTIEEPADAVDAVGARPEAPDGAGRGGTATEAVARETVPHEGASGQAAAGSDASEVDPDAQGDAGQPLGVSPTIFTEEQLARVVRFALREALAYAMRHARDLQGAKEELYLAALDLTLERHLWTPQFVADVQASATYLDAGGLRDEERTFQTISEVSLTQRLPYGGEITARALGTLLRDLAEHVAEAESGSVILEANLPLLRGAGRVAYESRYQAERDLVYAVRTYERFRRSFLVDAASRYFRLQELKAAVGNTYVSYESRRRDWEKANFITRMGQSRDVFEAPRAKSILRQAEAALVSAKERYESELDRFKVFLGMPLDELLDVEEQEADRDAGLLDALLPNTSRATAVAVALEHRLDLLNSADGVDDTRRGVSISRNRLLPDLEATASGQIDSDPERLNMASLNPERGGWSAGLQLRLDDRKRERNAYRASLIGMRRAERQHDQFSDQVRADVRAALRRIDQQGNLRTIQALNVQENELRLEAARAQFNLGKSTNQDVVDAENDLLRARNELANAVAAYREAILQFRLDTGTLRVSDDGRIESLAWPDAPSGP